jgi:C-terminal processing protease CtpA/Prc
MFINSYSSSFKICSLLRGGIAERGGVRVGHRIIEINGQSVVATQHEKIVSMLSNSVGEVSNHFYICEFIFFCKMISFFSFE